jgi:hypothetical protein
MTSNDKIEVIHNLHEPHFKGTNFMGKFHDTKSHIQFINYIKGNIVLDECILERFFTSYNIAKWKDLRHCEPLSTIPQKILSLKEQIDTCDFYIFEICSLKQYMFRGHYCQFEQMKDNDISEYDVVIQSEKELFDDLYTIRSFFAGKKIIFQCHFRPNIICDSEELALKNRELIYKTLLRFCELNNNCYLYDPSDLLNKNNRLYDGDTHFTEEGLKYSFERIYELILSS